MTWQRAWLWGFDIAFPKYFLDIVQTMVVKCLCKFHKIFFWNLDHIKVLKSNCPNIHNLISQDGYEITGEE